MAASKQAVSMNKGPCGISMTGTFSFSNSQTWRRTSAMVKGTHTWTEHGERRWPKIDSPHELCLTRQSGGIVNSRQRFYSQKHLMFHAIHLPSPITEPKVVSRASQTLTTSQSEQAVAWASLGEGDLSTQTQLHFRQIKPLSCHPASCSLPILNNSLLHGLVKRSCTMKTTSLRKQKLRPPWPRRAMENGMTPRRAMQVFRAESPGS